MKLKTIKNICSLALLMSWAVVFQAQPEWETVAIPMSDGEELAADVYLPSDEGEFPVIFIQTPYNKDLYHLGLPLGVGWDQSEQPYAFVVMDWRCHFASLAACVEDFDRGQDGYDAVQWIAEQDWCTGKIGTYGPSALGNIQFQTAQKQPPNLYCCVPEVCAPVSFYEHYFPGGDARTEYIQTLGTLFGAQGGIMAFPYDGMAWDIAESLTTYPDEIVTPMLLIGGWYDINIPDQVEMIELLADESPVGDQHKILIGPWVHGGASTANVGSLEQGELEYPGAQHVNHEWALQMFDYYLRDIDNGYPELPRVNYHIQGETNVWAESTVPFGGSSEPMTLFLHHADNSLKWSSPGDEVPSQSFMYDPEDPSPSIGGQVLSLEQGPLDQGPEVESRDDKLIFTYSESEEFIVEGIITLSLWVSSDQVDTDIVVRLTDVHPDGSSMLINSGVKRLRFINGFTVDDEAFLTPDEMVQVEVKLPPLAHHFGPNHKMRIIVTSSDYPHYNRNMNTGGEMYPGGDPDILVNPLVAENTLYSDYTHPSTVNIPVSWIETSIVESSKNDIRVYPSPADQFINVRMDKAYESWEILNAVGKILKSGKVNMFPLETMRIGELPAGFYFVRLITHDEQSVVKICVAR